LEYFKNINNSTEEKVNNLIEWLLKKDESGIQNFVKALNEAHEHSGHFTILNEMLVQIQQFS